MRKQSLQVSWIAVCAIVTVVYFTAIYVAISHIETLAANLGLSGDIGRFVSEKNLNLIGDTLAGIFSPLALIWLVAAVLIQSQELKLQRQEIAENRSVMHDQRAGSVCLNSFGRFAKWISASIMPPPSLVSAR